MATRCIALLSGGLDSMLAIRLIQEQGIEVEALNFKTLFTCCQDASGQAARELGVRLTVIGSDDDYLDLLRKPKYGYGKGANPCVDCRIYMFERARQFMDQVKAQFVISGEIVGQRPMSQKRNDLDNIRREAGLSDLLLRPLSAKVLPPTRPELDGLVDREKLCGFVGRSRKGLIQLAKKFGFQDIPQPSTGCTLTERQFSHKVHDLIQLDPNNTRWDFELLKYGRHFRINPTSKIVVGRNLDDNSSLEYMHELRDARSTAILKPKNFAGPMALVIGSGNEDEMDYAGALILKYSKIEKTTVPTVIVHREKESTFRIISSLPEAEAAQTLSSAH